MFGWDRLIIFIFELKVDIEKFHITWLALLLLVGVDLILLSIYSVEILKLKFKEVILCNEFFYFFLYGI